MAQELEEWDTAQVRLVTVILGALLGLVACGAPAPHAPVQQETWGLVAPSSGSPEQDSRATPVRIADTPTAIPPGYPKSLRLESGGEVVGAVRSPLSPREVDAAGRVLLAEAQGGRPAQYARIADGTAAGTILSLQAHRVISGHIGWLRSDTSVQFAHFFCQPLEVLGENAGYVRVRLTNGPYMLVGWTKGPLAARGNADCSAEAITAMLHPKRGAAVATVRAPLPPGHVAADSDVSAFAFQGEVFVRPDRGGLCQKWSFVRDADGLSLRRRVVRIVGKGGLWETSDTLPFDQDPPSAHYLTTSSGGHWMQKPQGPQTPPSTPEDTGAQWPFQVVRVLPSRVEWTETRFATSYDPATAKIWYRTENACNVGARSSVQSAGK